MPKFSKALLVFFIFVALFAGILTLVTTFLLDKTPLTQTLTDTVGLPAFLMSGGLFVAYFFIILELANRYIAPLNDIGDVLVKVWGGDERSQHSYDFTAPNHQRNRRNMISVVRQAWIEGVLYNSLHEAVRLELGMAKKPEALAHPWRLHKRQPNQPDMTIPQGTPIQQIYRAGGEALLILGAPGSGKTFTLLELAQDLLREAETDHTTPVPVVLNLSSWAREKPPLADWLVEELFTQYQLARHVSQAWLERGEMCLLLDGLDEVAEGERDQCVTAINDFMANHSMPLVVCSREGDYARIAQKVKLNLRTAVVIQPLTDEHIDAYLREPALHMEATRQALQTDEELQELARTPLMLNLMTLAYWGLTREEVDDLGSSAHRRHHIFNYYIQRMFVDRPPIKESYTILQALHYLSFLSRQLTERNHSIFFMERIHSGWFPYHIKRRYHIVFGLISASYMGLLFFFVLQPVSILCGFWGAIIIIFLLGFLEYIRSVMASSKDNQKIKSLKKKYQASKKITLEVFGYMVLISLVISISTAIESDLSLTQIILSSFGSLIFIILTFLFMFGRVADEFLENLILRWLLRHQLPLQLISFLEAMKQRILMQRVGGGYRFVHRSVQEHIAGLSRGEILALAGRIDQQTL